MTRVVVYTDGACSGNPGPGGFAAILDDEGKQTELTGGFRRTTNNRMEMFAVIVALEHYGERRDILIHSDSRYVVDAINKGWVRSWKRRGWLTAKGEPAKNKDLWQRFEVAQARHRIELRWVKGHADNELNNRCDELAVAACVGATEEDEGFTGVKPSVAVQGDLFAQ